ncbi:MAG: hypothetical protein ACE5FT_01950 [Candidatus Nanoarchaeia archaeon]
MTKIIKLVNKGYFKSLLQRAKIEPTKHTFFHVHIGQRNIYNITYIKKLTKRTPVLVGIQKNSLYAAYYKIQRGYTKVIMERKGNTFKIITFLNTGRIPKIR